MPRYAIVIPAYNEEAFLPVTLAAVRKAMDLLKEMSGEIIVVNNNSTDRTDEVAQAYGADRVIFEPINQISRARNTGARAALKNAACEYLIFLDADTQLPARLLKQALKALHSEAVCGGGAITESDHPPPFVVSLIYDAWNWCAEWFGMAAGSFVFCRRDGFEAIGGFDENVFAGEEVWFSRKLRHWGRKKGLEFRVFSDPPIVTSGRKSDWFPSWMITGQLVMLAACPWAARSRKLCRIWYRRPATHP